MPKHIYAQANARTFRLSLQVKPRTRDRRPIPHSPSLASPTSHLPLVLATLVPTPVLLKDAGGFVRRFLEALGALAVAAVAVALFAPDLLKDRWWLLAVAGVLAAGWGAVTVVT